MAAGGAYGKLPSAGDFIRIRLSRGFVDAWDSWLQDWISEVRTTMGSAWEQSYMSAPIWRFTLGRSVAGQNGCLGVFLASVDRVGRQFPLTLVVDLPSEARSLPQHFANDRLFEALEEIALTVLEDDIDQVALDRMLADIPDPAEIGAVSAGSCTWMAVDRTALRAHLAAQTVGNGRGHCVWSSDDGHSVRMLTTEALPGAKTARAFFDTAHPLWHNSETTTAA